LLFAIVLPFSRSPPDASADDSGTSTGARSRSYDVAPDGRFLMLVQNRQEEPTIHVVLNWFEELERLVPSN
jgi:hypothetical protein